MLISWFHFNPMVLQALQEWLLVMPFVHRNEDSTCTDNINTHYDNTKNLICIIIISVTVENKLSRGKSRFSKYYYWGGLLQLIVEYDCWLSVSSLLRHNSREAKWSFCPPPLRKVSSVINTAAMMVEISEVLWWLFNGKVNNEPWSICCLISLSSISFLLYS